MVRSSFLMARQLAADPDPAGGGPGSGDTVVLQVLLLAAAAAVFLSLSSEKKSTSMDLRPLPGGVPFPSSAASMVVVLVLWNGGDVVGGSRLRKPRGRGDASRANRPPTPRWALSMQEVWGMRSSQVRSDSSSAACRCSQPYVYCKRGEEGRLISLRRRKNGVWCGWKKEKGGRSL